MLLSVMALLTGLRGDLQLEGVFCLSGYLPLVDSVRESGGGGGKGADKFPHVREGTGMKANGEKDHIMKLDWVDKSRDRDIVKELGYPVDSSIIPYVEIPYPQGICSCLVCSLADLSHRPVKRTGPQYRPRGS